MVHNRGQLGALYFDLNKAFGVVCHALRITKITKMDLPSFITALVSNYRSIDYASLVLMDSFINYEVIIAEFLKDLFLDLFSCYCS